MFSNLGNPDFVHRIRLQNEIEERVARLEKLVYHCIQRDNKLERRLALLEGRHWHQQHIIPRRNQRIQDLETRVWVLAVLFVLLTVMMIFVNGAIISNDRYATWVNKKVTMLERLLDNF
jgi:hypothetical protein